MMTMLGVTVGSQQRSPSFCWSVRLLLQVRLFAQREGTHCQEYIMHPLAYKDALRDE